MKLDSEQQRTDLLELLGSISFTVTAATIDQTKEKIDSVILPIKNAEIEPDEKEDKKNPNPKGV